MIVEILPTNRFRGTFWKFFLWPEPGAHPSALNQQKKNKDT